MADDASDVVGKLLWTYLIGIGLIFLSGFALGAWIF